MKVEVEIDNTVEVKKVGENIRPHNDKIKFDGHHAFYFYGTNAANLKPIVERGVVLIGSNYLGSVMLRFDRESMGPSIDYAIREYAKTNRFENVFLIKIPLGIMEGLDDKGEPIIPIPLLMRGRYDINSQQHDNVVPNYFIFGIYNLPTNQFRENPNYSIRHNPNGMVYTSDQIVGNLTYYPQLKEWKRFALDREKSELTYEEMYKEDEHKRPFDELVDKYSWLGVIEDYRKPKKKSGFSLFKRKKK